MRLQRWFTSIALVIGGTLAGILALELLLQIAALGLRLTHTAPPQSWLGGRLRVLCVGDSSTYGLYLTDRNQSYPRQLEQLWNADGTLPQIEVMNAGYPGMNSSRLRQTLRPMLEALHPDVVIVMIGANDYWTERVPVDASHSWGTTVVDVIRGHSRLYRLMLILRRSADRRQLEVPNELAIRAKPDGVIRFGDAEFSVGWKAVYGQHNEAFDSIINLEAMAAETRRLGARMIFLTYPSHEWNYGDGGQFTRLAAAKASVPLVDMAEVFTPLCPKEPCPDLFYKDHHPTAAGYKLMAETLVQRRIISSDTAPAASDSTS